VDLGIRACLIKLDVVDRPGFDRVYGEWTSLLGDEPGKKLSAVAIQSQACSELEWLRAESDLASFRESQDAKAYAAACVGLDPDLILAAVEAATLDCNIAAQIDAGNATPRAGNRRLLEDYLNVFHPMVRANRSIVRRIIAKLDFEKLSQAQEFPGFDDMRKTGVNVVDLAIALVAGADIVSLAADAQRAVAGGGAAGINARLTGMLLNELPELGCEGRDGTR
jgi:hypothetical protein